jgi:hypothetical protein
MKNPDNPSAGNTKRKKRTRSVIRGTLLAAAALIVAALALIARSSPFNPVSSAFNTAGFVLTSRLHFPKDRLGEMVTDDAGHEYRIFRQVLVDPRSDQPAVPGATLILHFKVTNMSPAANQLFSFLPLALYIGDPGFRSKLFTINGDDCQSIYQWDTINDAENSLKWVALKTIIGRAVPGSVTSKIVPAGE